MKTYCIIDQDNNSTYTDDISNLPPNVRVFEYDIENNLYIEIFDVQN